MPGGGLDNSGGSASGDSTSNIWNTSNLSAGSDQTSTAPARSAQPPENVGQTSDTGGNPSSGASDNSGGVNWFNSGAYTNGPDTTLPINTPGSQQPPANSDGTSTTTSSGENTGASVPVAHVSDAQWNSTLSSYLPQFRADLQPPATPSDDMSYARQVLQPLMLTAAAVRGANGLATLLVYRDQGNSLGNWWLNTVGPNRKVIATFNDLSNKIDSDIAAQKRRGTINLAAMDDLNKKKSVLNDVKDPLKGFDRSAIAGERNAAGNSLFSGSELKVLEKYKGLQDPIQLGGSFRSGLWNAGKDVLAGTAFAALTLQVNHYLQGTIDANNPQLSVFRPNGYDAALEPSTFVLPLNWSTKFKLVGLEYAFARLHNMDNGTAALWSAGSFATMSGLDVAPNVISLARAGTFSGSVQSLLSNAGKWNVKGVAGDTGDIFSKGFSGLSTRNSADGDYMPAFLKFMKGDKSLFSDNDSLTELGAKVGIAFLINGIAFGVSRINSPQDNSGQLTDAMNALKDDQQKHSSDSMNSAIAQFKTLGHTDIADLMHENATADSLLSSGQSLTYDQNRQAAIMAAGLGEAALADGDSLVQPTAVQCFSGADKNIDIGGVALSNLILATTFIDAAEKQTSDKSQISDLNAVKSSINEEIQQIYGTHDVSSAVGDLAKWQESSQNQHNFVQLAMNLESALQEYQKTSDTKATAAFCRDLSMLLIANAEASINQNNS
ncbi:MAG TPA: hypothetical protein V6C72_04620, partial [Chroococcales cyanobacterium]